MGGHRGLCVCVSRYPLSSKESGPPAAGATGSYESPDVDGGNRTLVFSKSNKYF